MDGGKQQQKTKWKESLKDKWTQLMIYATQEAVEKGVCDTKVWKTCFDYNVTMLKLILSNSSHTTDWESLSQNSNILKVDF